MSVLPREDSSRVLVVDDSESNRYVLGTWLKRAGYAVFEASTGKEALHFVDNEQLDLVLLDINLPDMTGYDVCEYIKGNTITGAVPVLHVSATATGPADRSEGLRRGADGYLVEPVEREELLASVGALLRGAAAQRTAVRLAYRLRRLNDASTALSAAATLERLVSTIAREASALFECMAIVAVSSTESGHVARAAQDVDIVSDLCVPEAVDVLRRVAHEHDYISARSLGRFGPENDAIQFSTTDLSEPGGHHGCLFIEVPASSHGGPAAEENDIVLEQFARACTAAIRTMRTFDIERHIALTLQQHLLPDVMLDIPGLDVAVRYKASAEHAEVGGDFYEVFSLDDGRIALAIGDVVGHSLAAAAVMAQLRTGVRSYMLEGHGPTAVLDRLNRLLLRFHRDITATVCCAVYDLAAGTCELANAGHPAPMLMTSAGRSTFLPDGGPLLGIEAEAAAAYSFTIDAGSVLLLYTDGLIERRGEMIDDGFARLGRVPYSAGDDLEDVCDRLLRDAGPASMNDDIAIVAIRPAG